MNYNNPIELLDFSLKSGAFFETVASIFYENENKKLWDLYLAFKPNKSFNDWKKSISSDEIHLKNVGTKTKEETDRIIEKTNKILKMFTPKG